jgi:transcriptional regulator with XRE-family HTH domain
MNSPTAIHWGRMIRERRTVLGLSQRQLADTLGVTQAAVTGWETGKSLPSRRNVSRLARTLGLPAAAFVYVDDVA